MILQSSYKEEYSDSTSKLILKDYKSNNKALFVDRDGILIEDIDHIDCPSKVKLCKNVIPFLKQAHKLNYDVVIVTNQSSVSRSIITYHQYIEITNTLISYLPESLYPNLILASFHLPNNENDLPNFDWRKPGAGMFNYALKLYNYEPMLSIMVGDKLTDLIPADSINISNLIYIPSTIHIKELSRVINWNKLNNSKIKIKARLSSEIF